MPTFKVWMKWGYLNYGFCQNFCQADRYRDNPNAQDNCAVGEVIDSLKAYNVEKVEDDKAGEGGHAGDEDCLL